MTARSPAAGEGTVIVSNEQKAPEAPEEGSAWQNIGKLLFLIAVLVGAWFLLDRLINGK